MATTPPSNPRPFSIPLFLSLAPPIIGFVAAALVQIERTNNIIDFTPIIRFFIACLGTAVGLISAWIGKLTRDTPNTRPSLTFAVILNLIMAPIAFLAFVLLPHYLRAYTETQQAKAEVWGQSGHISDFVVQPNAQILIVGSGGVVRLNPDGSLDSGFFNTLQRTPEQHDWDTSPNNVLLLPDGSALLLSGASVTWLDPRGHVLQELRPLQGFVHSAIQLDGKALIASNTVKRFFQNGKIDTSFNAAVKVSSNVNYLKVAQGGKILVAGSIYLPGKESGYPVARLNSNGSLDPTFHLMDNIKNPASFFTQLPDRTLLAIIDTDSPPIVMDQDGRPEAHAPMSALTSLPAFRSVCRLPQGAYLVGSSSGLSRYFSDGSPDPTFTQPPEARQQIIKIEPQAGKYLVLDANSQKLLRLDADGVLDSSFHLASLPVFKF